MEPIVPAGPPSVRLRPIAGLLTSGRIPLGSAMEPIGAPSAPPPSLPYRPSLQRPPAFVSPTQIKPAAPEPKLFNPHEMREFGQGKFPKQNELFQESVERPTQGDLIRQRLREMSKEKKKE